MPLVRTSALEIEYEEHGDPSGTPVVLLHGFPDSLKAWETVLASLDGMAGLRVITPSLRGYGKTRILDEQARTGQIAALAQDALDLLDALGIERAVLAGHDWGARAVWGAAVLAPGRVAAAVGLASEYVASAGKSPSYKQLQAYWYQWFFHTPQAQETLTRDRSGFCEHLWQTWSPEWRFTASEFAEAAASWQNDDFIPTVLSYYRQRHGNAPGSPIYAEQQRRLDAKPRITVPALYAVGLADACNLPQSSLGQEAWFAGGYERVELPGVGHFLPREAGREVALLLRRAISQSSARGAGAD